MTDQLTCNLDGSPDDLAKTRAYSVLKASPDGSVVYAAGLDLHFGSSGFIHEPFLLSAKISQCNPACSW
jgi:hypothetical protein